VCPDPLRPTRFGGHPQVLCRLPGRSASLDLVLRQAVLCGRPEEFPHELHTASMAPVTKPPVMNGMETSET
jgi:hypothetical protein